LNHLDDTPAVHAASEYRDAVDEAGRAAVAALEARQKAAACERRIFTTFKELTMKTLVFVAMLFPGVALAQGVFDGTWKIDTSNVKFPQKPEQFVLTDGMYSCATCVPKYEVKSDGTDQKVTGSKYRDTVAVKIIDKHTVQLTSKKDGKVVSEGKITISADGRTLTEEFTSYPPAGQSVTGKVISERVAEGPAGSHLLSGSWRTKKVDAFSDSGLTMTFKSTTDGLSMSSPTGESYDAKFDGKDYPVKGDRGGSMVSLKRVDDRTIEETMKRDGKVVGVARITAGTDGKTLNFTYENKERGTTMSYVARKQ
jgi:hypothetical protein